MKAADGTEHTLRLVAKTSVHDAAKDRAKERRSQQNYGLLHPGWGKENRTLFPELLSPAGNLAQSLIRKSRGRSVGAEADSQRRCRIVYTIKPVSPSPSRT